eukprot:TRINITY_DN40563_c0_g1_i1.p1 TRINITY_DN40563_c0_g1~~TRINITY_DN40563_c0_g1_i1.p1  ORF type:complete len:621 (-),score=76.84 TRINITY_DN40563_c0_g1_i1:103-1965(-)
MSLKSDEPEIRASLEASGYVLHSDGCYYRVTTKDSSARSSSPQNSPRTEAPIRASPPGTPSDSHVLTIRRRLMSSPASLPRASRESSAAPKEQVPVPVDQKKDTDTLETRATGTNAVKSQPQKHSEAAAQQEIQELREWLLSKQRSLDDSRERFLDCSAALTLSQARCLGWEEDACRLRVQHLFLQERLELVLRSTAILSKKAPNSSILATQQLHDLQVAEAEERLAIVANLYQSQLVFLLGEFNSVGRQQASPHPLRPRSPVDYESPRVVQTLTQQCTDFQIREATILEELAATQRRADDAELRALRLAQELAKSRESNPSNRLQPTPRKSPHRTLDSPPDTKRSPVRLRRGYAEIPPNLSGSVPDLLLEKERELEALQAECDKLREVHRSALDDNTFLLKRLEETERRSRSKLRQLERLAVRNAGPSAHVGIEVADDERRKIDSCCRITGVTGPARSTSLQTGDVITKITTTSRIGSAADFRASAAQLRSGDVVSLSVKRQGSGAEHLVSLRAENASARRGVSPARESPTPNTGRYPAPPTQPQAQPETDSFTPEKWRNSPVPSSRRASPFGGAVIPERLTQRQSLTASGTRGVEKAASHHRPGRVSPSGRISPVAWR